MKQCSVCKLEKELSEFPLRKTSKDGRHSNCLECQKLYRKAHYLANKDHCIAKTKRNKEVVREWYKDYKSSLSCERCGFSNPVALDFHHKDPKTKLFEVSIGAGTGYGIDTILKEIEKCSVLCANCHRIEHHCPIV